MWSFFEALFGATWFSVAFGSERKKELSCQNQIDETKARADKWYARINSGPLNNYDFGERMRDSQFRKKLFSECNAILDSIPELNGIHLDNEYSNETQRVMEMMYNARTGDVSMMWFSGWVHNLNLTKCFSRRPTQNGCKAFIAWYEGELRRNGYYEATILPVYSREFIVAWYFVDSAASYEMIKRELYIV